MLAEYDAVVIGSGFGGAVSACRLSQAGLSVALFERGRRYDGPQPFPRNWRDVTDGWLWKHDQGLFDIKEVSEVTIVESAGYGGGSLIYANVHLRPPPEVFAHGWPRAYSREVLDPYYDLVAHMLDIKPITAEEPSRIPPKTWLMRDVAGQLERSAQFLHPNIAVNFGDPEHAQLNKHGVSQLGCNHCGECDIGCNQRAKNTLDMNYLPLAERSQRFEVRTRSEVTKIARVGDKYRVQFRDHATRSLNTVVSEAVFVCAGAVNSTELLLRCRDQHRSLPDLSPALGHHYSGNGDYLAFAFDTDPKRPFQPSQGPTITTAIVYDGADAGDRQWFIFQEGGYPKEIVRLLQVLNPNKFKLGIEQIGKLKLQLTQELRQRADQARSIPADGINSAVFLAMGRDKANGRIDLMPGTNLLRIHWETCTNMGLYSAEERFSQDIAKALRGTFGSNPFWKLLKQPVSVHNLGGCAMADDPSGGVVDEHGEVFGYPNLFVMDGSALPAATGVNPSHTIAAVTERNIERYIRKRLKDELWHAPERARVTKVIDPLSTLRIPPKGTRPPDTEVIGLTFTETMKGYLSRGVVPPEDFASGARLGEAQQAKLEFTLTITFPDFVAFKADRSHAGNATGTVHVAGFTPPEGARVTSGVFNLFVPTDSAFERRMLYALPFFGSDGKPYLLDGFKEVRDHGAFDVWAATSTLYTVIRAGHERTDPICATGIMHILKRDFAHQMTTLRTIGKGSLLERAEAVAQFGELFLGTLVDVFLRPRLE
jgi:cholesterol oxidase